MNMRARELKYYKLNYCVNLSDHTMHKYIFCSFSVVDILNQTLYFWGRNFAINQIKGGEICCNPTGNVNLSFTMLSE